MRSFFRREFETRFAYPLAGPLPVAALPSMSLIPSAPFTRLRTCATAWQANLH